MVMSDQLADDQHGQHRLPFPLLSFFSTGAIGFGIWASLPGLFLLFFMTNILDIAPAIAGAVLFVPRLADIIFQPFIGAFTDRQFEKRRDRRGLMLLGLLLAPTMVLLFWAPGGMTGAAAAVWVGIFYLIGNFFFTSYQLPYMAVAVDVDVAHSERLKFFSYRVAFLTIGLLLVGALAPHLVANDTRQSYVTAAIVFAVILLAAWGAGLSSTGPLTRTRMGIPKVRTHRTSWREILQSAVTNADLRRFCLVTLLVFAPLQILLTSVAYTASTIYGRTELTALLTSAFLIVSLLGVTVWRRVALRVGKARALAVAIIIYVVGSLLLCLALFGPIGGAMAAMALLGFAYSGNQVLMDALIPDVALRADPKSTVSGTFMSMYMVCYAVAIALGPWIFSIVLAIGGYQESAAAETVVQPEGAKLAIILGSSILPALLMLLALVALRRFARGYGSSLAKQPMSDQA